jgi:sulfur carrier protein ThiS
MEKIKVVSYNEVKGKNFDILVTLEDLEELLKRLGYKIDETGVILDSNGKPVKGVDGREINIKEDKELTIVAGSLIFTRNIAELSEILIRKGLLQFQIK